MRFDDRLATLLTQPVATPRDRAVRWRQLVELVARAPQGDGGDSAIMVAALAVIASEAKHVPTDIRTATARSIAGRDLPAALLDYFAGEELSVAASLFAGAALSDEDRHRLVGLSKGDLRVFLGNLWPDIAAGPQDVPNDDEVEAARFGDVVEQLKAARADLLENLPSPEPTEQGDGAGDAPDSGKDSIRSFRWESGPDGTIDWVEGAPRASLVGRRITRDGQLGELMASRQAIAIAQSDFAGLPGRWMLRATPEHDGAEGKFLGYSGEARREDDPAPAERDEGDVLTRDTVRDDREPARDAQSLRELVHEIKTPLNAIIGFAEIIDGQYLGPAHRRYRERAAEIVTQARILLEAIRDLDLAARVKADGGSSAAPLHEVIDAMLPALAAKAARRGVGVDLAPGGDTSPCATDRKLAERLCERIVGALLETCASGETLRLSIRQDGDRCALAYTRPPILNRFDDDRLFDPALVLEKDEGAVLGLGFSLRLARGLAQTVGGNVRATPEHLVLELPRA